MIFFFFGKFVRKWKTLQMISIWWVFCSCVVGYFRKVSFDGFGFDFKISAEFLCFSQTFYKKSTLEWCERKYFWDWEQIIWRMTLKALWTLLSFSVLKSLNFEFFQVKIFLTTEICAAIFSKTGFGKCVYKVNEFNFTNNERLLRHIIHKCRTLFPKNKKSKSKWTENFPRLLRRF